VSDRRYNIQCISHGFCGTVGPGDELYDECVKREAEGYIDALCLGPDNDFCGECNEERSRMRRWRLKGDSDVHDQQG